MQTHNLLIYVFLVWVSLPMLDSAGNCIGKGSCHLHPWATWGPCIGTCGFYFKERSRSLCCPFTVIPRTIENCVHYCNITSGVNERRYCLLCGNGTIDYNTMDCLCKPYYKGKCCQELVTCNDSPCLHGSCGDSPSGFVCHCEEGYKGADCGIGEKISKQKLPWQSVVGYLFLAIFPFCILFSIFYICVKCCPFWKKTPERGDKRPKAIRSDGKVRELTWERVTSRNSTLHSHANNVPCLNKESITTRPLQYFEIIPQYRTDFETSQVTRNQNTRHLPISKPGW